MCIRLHIDLWLCVSFSCIHSYGFVRIHWCTTYRQAEKSEREPSMQNQTYFGDVKLSLVFIDAGNQCSLCATAASFSLALLFASSLYMSMCYYMLLVFLSLYRFSSTATDFRCVYRRLCMYNVLRTAWYRYSVCMRAVHSVVCWYVLLLLSFGLFSNIEGFESTL